MHTIAPKAVKQAEGAPLKTGLAPPLFMGACFAHSAGQQLKFVACFATILSSEPGRHVICLPSSAPVTGTGASTRSLIGLSS